MGGNSSAVAVAAAVVAAPGHGSLGSVPWALGRAMGPWARSWAGEGRLNSSTFIKTENRVRPNVWKYRQQTKNKDRVFELEASGWRGSIRLVEAVLTQIVWFLELRKI